MIIMLGLAVGVCCTSSINLRGCLCLQHGRVLPRLCEQHLLVTNFLATCCMPAQDQASASMIKV